MEKKKRKTVSLTGEKFTLRDFRGVIVLLAVLLSVQLAVYFIRVFPEREESGFSESVRTEENGKKDMPKAAAPREQVRHGEKVKLHPFDPNTVDSASLVSFGFSPKQTASILKYRRSGGRFREPSDFARLYVVNEYMYNRLLPYMEIREKAPRRPKEPLDLNRADSAQLDLLPGIGGFYARRILEYRDRLGWFVDKEQLLEIYRFGEDRFERLKDRVSVGEVDRVYLADCDSAFIVSHPYLGRSAYRAVREYDAFAAGRKPSMQEYLENKVIISLNGKYLLLQFR